MHSKLPDEIIARIDLEARQFAFYNYVTQLLHPNAEFERMDAWPQDARVCYYSILHYMSRPDICWPYKEPTLATEWAQWKLRFDELKKEADDLQRWKREACMVIDPIIEYGQGHPDAKLGHSIVTFVIDRCKDYDRIKERCEKMEAALNSLWPKYADDWSTEMRDKVTEAFESTDGHNTESVTYIPGKGATLHEGIEKEVRPEHNISIGEHITYCHDCGFPVDECNCIENNNSTK